MQADTQGVLSAQSFHAEAPVNPFAPSDAPFLAPHASTSDNVAKALSGLPAEPVVPQNTDAVHGTLFAGTPLRSLFPDNVAKALAGLHIEQVDPQGTAIVDSSCSAAFPRAQSQPLDVTSAIYELNAYQTVSESATSVPQARRRKHVVRRVAQAPVCPHNEPTPEAVYSYQHADHGCAKRKKHKVEVSSVASSEHPSRSPVYAGRL